VSRSSHSSSTKKSGGFLGGDPLGHGRGRRGFHGQRAHRQGADHFTQGGQQVFGAFRAGRVHQDQALFRRDGGEGRRAADKGARQEGLDDFILDLVAFLFIDLAHLLGFDLFDLFLDRVTHDAAWQNAFFLAAAISRKSPLTCTSGASSPLPNGATKP
jgi:hypothetical protein